MSENIAVKTELLAPAGTPACALAAFDAGADAIYCGLDKFNARERSENFTIDSLSKIIKYAHSINRKVYLAFNTLIKEKELPQVVEYLSLIAKLNIDAVIVQDLGVVRLIREYFPSLVIHGSTQMGIHNSVGVKLAKKMGMERVILERQITLDELKIIRKNSDIELEVFVHGALCCSLSGQCLFSSYMGGYSGNRGRCKQPCRRRFFSNKGNGFFFSPQDLCTIDMVPMLRDMKIESLKIEGRLRQADYVYNVVSAYRMILDTPTEQINSQIMGEAKRLLSKTCGRKWSHGFFEERAMQELILHENMGSAGMLCGEIKGLSENGFSFVAKKKIHVGDRLRIQPHSGDDGPAMTITKMFVNNRDSKKAKVGEEVFICYDRVVPMRGLIYKIGESFKDYSNRVDKLPLSKKKIDLEIFIAQNSIRINTLNLLENINFERSIDLQKAAKHALNSEKVQNEFAIATSMIFDSGDMKIYINGEYFFPNAILKELRQDFWNLVKDEVKSDVEIIDNSAESLTKFYLDYRNMNVIFANNEVANSETVAMRPNGEVPGNRRAKKATSVFDFNKMTNQVILPEFTAQARVETLTKAIKNAYINGIRSFRVSSIFELLLLEEYDDIEIVSSAPIPVCNSMAVMELKSLGANRVQAHLELDKKSIEELRDHSPLAIEVYRYGRPVLLISRATIPVDGLIKDARTNEFVVKHDNRSRLCRVYPQSIMSIPRVERTYDYYDLLNANWRSQDTTPFNFELELL